MRKHSLHLNPSTKLVIQTYFADPLNRLSHFSVKTTIVWTSPSQKAQLGANVTLGCTATGRPTPRVTWKKDGRILLEGQASANITLSSISPADSGSYECLAANIVSNDIWTVVLYVEGTKTHFIYAVSLFIIYLVKIKPVVRLETFFIVFNEKKNSVQTSLRQAWFRCLKRIASK